MNDPHVDTLVYRIVYDNGVVDWSDAKLEQEMEGFRVLAKDGKVLIEFKDHHPSIAEAKDAISKYLRTWEFDLQQQRGPGGFRLEFDPVKSKIVDRDTDSKLLSACVYSGVPTASMNLPPPKHPHFPEIPQDNFIDDLLVLIHDMEDELLEGGKDPKDRALAVPIEVRKKLGGEFPAFGPATDPVLERIRNLHKPFYRDRDIASGGNHGGAFMFRGIATMILPPIIYGNGEINLFDWNDLNDCQMKWLQSDQSDLNAYKSTCCDICDFSILFSPVNDSSSPPQDSVKFLQLALFQLQGASTTLCHALDVRGSIQSALLGAELALKGALRGKGYTEDQLKQSPYGHNLNNLVEKVGEELEGYDKDKALQQCHDLPQLVENRYTDDQPNRIEAGKIVMSCQFIAGEVARVLTNWRLCNNLMDKPI